MTQYVSVNGKKYIVVDVDEKITFADSWVIKENKIGTGNGEAKLYLGQEAQKLRHLYGRRPFVLNCFLLKKDLVSFLEDMQPEYVSPQQDYSGAQRMQSLYDERLRIVENLSDTIEFTVEEQQQITGGRIYVKSSNEIWKVLRTLALPNISYMSIMKVRSSKHASPLYYWRPFVDFDEGGVVRKWADQSMKNRKEEKSDYKKRPGRIGQENFKRQLIQECRFCPFTDVNDERLLIASHIKPWAKCTRSEQTDVKNGFLFTPTYDYLFDKGFITFSDERHLIVSPWLAPMTLKRLALKNGKVVSNLPIEGREEYLKYHREHQFKGV